MDVSIFGTEYIRLAQPTPVTDASHRLLGLDGNPSEGRRSSCGQQAITGRQDPGTGQPCLGLQESTR